MVLLQCRHRPLGRVGIYVGESGDCRARHGDGNRILLWVCCREGHCTEKTHDSQCL